jgi:chloramphenicol-sensitive protein RarD
VTDQRRGFFLGAAAYAMWGLFPLYWRLLEPAGAVEILAHRIVWSLVTMLALTLVLRRGSALRAIVRDRRVLVLLLVASVVISFNWGGFIYGVNHDRVVEVSLGYFINPLFTVLLGVLVLGERLRPRQWLAIGIATVAVLVLTVDYGHPPWIAFLLAASFGTYGLAKKKADVEAVESLTFETLVLAPVALPGSRASQGTGPGTGCCSRPPAWSPRSR